MAAFNTFDYKGEGLIQREDIITVMDFVFGGDKEESKGENNFLLQQEQGDDEKPLTPDEKEKFIHYFK